MHSPPGSRCERHPEAVAVAVIPGGFLLSHVGTQLLNSIPNMLQNTLLREQSWIPTQNSEGVQDTIQWASQVHHTGTGSAMARKGVTGGPLLHPPTRALTQDSSPMNLYNTTSPPLTFQEIYSAGNV